MIINYLEETFKNIEDPRSVRNQKHQFLSIIAIGLLSTIAGIDNFSGMAEFAECHEDALKKFIPLPNSIPSHDTLRRIFSELNPEAFCQCFMVFTEYIAEAVKGLLAIDGKTIRNSGKDKPLHLVSAWCEANSLVLGQVKADGRAGNEIEAIASLIGLLDVKDRIVTLDALGCQRDIAEKIVTSEGDYVIALKGNQHNLLEDVTPYFQKLEDFDGLSWQEWDKGHGRIEHRQCWALAADNWLIDSHKWPGLKSIAMVRSTRIIKDKETSDIRFYISSLKPDPELICKAARRHWAIENKLHWVLDVVFNEDKACIRNDNAAINVDILRKWALNIINIQKKKDVSIKSIQRRASMSFKFLTQLLVNAFHA